MYIGSSLLGTLWIPFGALGTLEGPCYRWAQSRVFGVDSQEPPTSLSSILRMLPILQVQKVLWFTSYKLGVCSYFRNQPGLCMVSLPVHRPAHHRMKRPMHGVVIRSGERQSAGSPQHQNSGYVWQSALRIFLVLRSSFKFLCIC